MMLSMTMKRDKVWQKLEAFCPSCGQRRLFDFAGEQHWPEKVAEVAGIEPVVRLWHCRTCNSTLSECDLH